MQSRLAWNKDEVGPGGLGFALLLAFWDEV